VSGDASLCRVKPDPWPGSWSWVVFESRRMRRYALLAQGRLSLAEGDAMLPLPLSPPWALQLQSRPLYPRDQVQERTGTLLSETGGGGDTMGETLAWGLGRKGVLDAEDWVLGEERVTCIMWCF